MNTIQHLVGRSVEPTSETRLDCLFIDNFEHTEDLIHVLRVRLLVLVVFDVPSGLKMLPKCRFIELCVLISLVNLA